MTTQLSKLESGKPPILVNVTTSGPINTLFGLSSYTMTYFISQQFIRFIFLLITTLMRFILSINYYFIILCKNNSFS